MVVSLGLTIIALEQDNAVSSDLEPLWKTSVAAVVMAAVLVLVRILFYSSFLRPV